MNTPRRLRGLSLAIVAICSPCLSAEPDETRLPLVPYPQTVEIQAGTFTPGKHLVVIHDESRAELGELAATCVRDLAALGFTASHGKAPPGKEASIINLALGEIRDIGVEGYRLEVDSGVTIAAATVEGLFWGTRTLLQLLHAGPQEAVPRLTIVDQPEFEYRGLMVDKLHMTTPEVIARWSPYMFGAGRSPQPFAYWKKFRPEDYRGKVLGAQTCSWAIEEKAEEGLLFGTGPGFPEYGRPGKRVPVMAERVWTGSGTTPKDLLERVGASYW